MLQREEQRHERQDIAVKPSPAPFRRGRSATDLVPSAAPYLPRKPKRQPVGPDLKAALRNRCGGRCELCGEALYGTFQAHHRRLRSQGGRDELPNLVALHATCHARVHSHPVWSRENGWIVSSEHDPATSRLGLRSESWVILSVSGTYEAVEAA